MVKNPKKSGSKQSSPTPDPLSSSGGGKQGDAFVRFILLFTRYSDDILGVILLSLGAMTFLSLLIPSLSGGILNDWITFLRRYFGWGVIWVVLGMVLPGIWLIRRQEPKKRSNNENFSLTGKNLSRLDNSSGETYTMQKEKPAWGRIFALEISAFSSLALLSILGGTSILRAEAGMDGGIVGWGLATLTGFLLEPLGLMGDLWAGLFFGMLALWGIIAGSGLWSKLVQKVNVEHPLSPVVNAETRLSSPPSQESMPVIRSSPVKVPVKQTAKNPFVAPVPRLQVEESQEQTNLPVHRDDRLPGLNILTSEEANRPDEKSINQTAGQIVRTLAEFGIPAEVVGYKIGPTVTQFAVKPGFVEKEKGQIEGEQARLKIRVAQISSLQKDLALALAAERLRIEAPVPGRPYVGIEVPNSRTMAVRLKPILELKNFQKVAGLPLAIALGRDVSGQPVVADLSKMPHLLIAGTTGSGKSICIAALAVCLVMNNLPDTLRLIMIDPKMVELQRFKGLPHLLGKVETELERILVVLKWVVAEMERRYKLLELSHSRNIDSYNKKGNLRKGEAPLPRIVVMIDELAELMMSAPEQTEHNLVRLAQMARAVGIHLVVATQRPSTEVVTGLIKANFPARIAFNVASSIDSRVILDTVGAENLLGRGDMLFLPPEASAPVRSQGVLVTDQEVDRVVSFWNKKMEPLPQTTPSPWDLMMDQDVVSDRDDLIERAIDIIKGSQRASTSMLQRRLRIGYPRAARLMEELEEMGIVGPSQSGGRDREVLLSNE